MTVTQPPEGILDPQQPWWPADKVGQVTWLRLKGKLTGRRVEGISENFTSYVKLGDADADRLIENIKKYGKYPTVNQNDKYGGALNNEAYQKWLVEEFLEKPFRKETDAKIEQAAIDSRMEEIDAERQKEKIKQLEKQAQKDKKSVPLPSIQEEKKEQDILDSDQEAIEEQVEKITTELDSVQEEEKKEETPEQTPEQDDSSKLDSDIQAISDSLLTIKGSLSNQISDLGSIERDSIKSLSALEGLKQLFQTQTDIIKRELGTSESKEREDSLEKSNVVSGTDEATSTTADNKAEGIIQGVDGPTITVKTTEGEFRQGQKISQGGGGGGLFDMLKGIAGKFMGGGKGGGGAGGGSPLKMSRGGIAVGPTKLAGGAFSPGIYSKPTRGNLGPGQAVVPLNRNIGKKMFPDQLKQTIKLQQPLADVMAQPLKAIGLSILAVAGNFLRLLGPLAGFFTPYVSGLVKGFAGVLGVPVAIVGALLGGPAYAAMEDQEKQQNVFAELWASLMEKLGFSSGDDGNKNKTKTKTKQNSGKVIQGGDADFWSLAAVASLEGINPQGEADVAQAVYNRVASGAYGVKTIKDAILSPGQFQPVTYDGADLNKWKAITDRESAIAAVATHKGKGIDTATKYVDEGAASITNPSLQKSASEFVGGRTDFAVASAANKYPGGFGYAERHGHLFGWYVGPGSIAYGKTNPGPASVPAFPISAESGTTTSDSSMGKMLGWSVVKGPNSGYDVDPTLEMHGEEAYLQYEKGFKILPIENNEFSLSKNPKETLTRWQELMNPGRASLENSMEKTSAAKGVTKRETLVERIFNFVKKDFINAFASDKPSKPALATLPASARQVTQYPQGVSTGVGGGNAGASTASRPTARQPARSPIGNPPSKNTPEIKKVPSETDVMMEQYEALAAAGKHSEAKELGMKIWNKTWRKTEKGIERIPTTPITATNATLPTASASSPTAVSSPQQIIVPIPASGGGAPAIVPLRTMKEEMELITLKNLC